MKDDELNKFANHFINLWQENFSKAIEDRKIIDYMMQATSNMQQFYDKSATAAAPNAYDAGAYQLHWGQLNGRIDELEQRLARIEQLLTTNTPKTGAGGGKRSKKKAV